MAQAPVYKIPRACVTHFYEPGRQQRRSLVDVRTRHIEPAFPLNDPVTGASRHQDEGEEERKNPPSHDGGRSYSPGSPLGLVVFISVRLVDDLLGDNLFNDICVYVWQPRYIYGGPFHWRICAATYLRG